MRRLHPVRPVFQSDLIRVLPVPSNTMLFTWQKELQPIAQICLIQGAKIQGLHRKVWPFFYFCFVPILPQWVSNSEAVWQQFASVEYLNIKFAYASGCAFISWAQRCA